jgi:hypothetical protein
VRGEACQALLALTLVLLTSRDASAEQRQDFMLDVQPEGTSVYLDYFFTGAQLTLEHRESIYDNANDVSVAAVAIPTYPLGDAFLRADLRILFLSLGASLGYRVVWRDLTFEPDPDGYCLRCDRAARRERDELLGRTPGSDRWYHGELRASLLFPFNEHLVGTSTFAARYEDRNDRSFDWFYASIYDRGVLGRWESQLFLKHRDWGGIGPYVQWLLLPRGDHHEGQLALGFNAVTRLGLVRSDDLLFLTFLARPSDGAFGQHTYYAPIRALLIYRLILDL